jgi:hypothetical protein
MLAAIGLAALVGCAGNADDAASDPTRATPAESEATPALTGVNIDVRRDPG